MGKTINLMLKHKNVATLTYKFKKYSPSFLFTTVRLRETKLLKEQSQSDVCVCFFS